MKKHILAPVFAMCTIVLSGCTFKFTYTLPLSPFKTESAGIEGDDFEDSGSYDIRIWCDTRIKDHTQMLVNDFITESAGKYDISYRIDTAGEDSAASSMIENVTAGADLYIFAQDQLSRLKTAGALSVLTGSYRELVTKETDVDGVNAASLNGKLYAFPFTSDNGYFMYYNKDVLGENDVKDMETLCTKLKAKGKKLNFPVFTNGWYCASYFMATGCKSEWTIDPNTNKFSGFSDNFKEKGTDACQGLKNLNTYAENKLFSTKDISDMSKNLGAVVSGMWDYQLGADTIGANKLGCCELPTFEANGHTYHLSSYKGYKLLGVKPTTDAKKLSVCKRLARYLSNKQAQLSRFNQSKWVPTNKELLQSSEVKNHPAVAALLKQRTYAQPQLQTPSSWYSAVAQIAKDVTSGGKAISTALNDYYSVLPSFISEE